MENENQKEKLSPLDRLMEHPKVTWPATGAVLGALIFGILYVILSSHQIYVENSSIVAPLIVLSPSAPGVLQEIDVKAGDNVAANQTVARVGNELIKTKIAGLVVSVDNTIGQLANPGVPVVTMIDPDQLRVVGQLEEDKGLSQVKVGQIAYFTADAFGSQKFSGVVDEIAPTANASDVVFNISDNREEQNFDVYVRYNVNQYPELKNGMSARIWIYK